MFDAPCPMPCVGVVCSMPYCALNDDCEALPRLLLHVSLRVSHAPCKRVEPLLLYLPGCMPVCHACAPHAHVPCLCCTPAVFFADLSDPTLRSVDDTFLLGSSLLVAAATTPDGIRSSPAGVALPRCTSWCVLTFDDQFPDLPWLFVRAGAIIPTARPLQTAELAMASELCLIVALDADGCARGELYEDDGALSPRSTFSHFYADKMQRAPGVRAIIRISARSDDAGLESVERYCAVRVLLSEGVEVSGYGDVHAGIEVELPSEQEEAESSRRWSATLRDLEIEAGRARQEAVSELTVSSTSAMRPKALESSELSLEISMQGGRITRLVHHESSANIFHSDSITDGLGYEEYAGSGYRCGGWQDQYHVVEEGLSHVSLEAPIGHGLLFRRLLTLQLNAILHVASSIHAENVGAGSGGFSKPVRIRVHPAFDLGSPLPSVDARHLAPSVEWTDISGERVVAYAPPHGENEIQLTGDCRPSGEWLLRSGAGWNCVNTFQIEQVEVCFLHWRQPDNLSVNLELWGAERPINATAPLQLEHSYRFSQCGFS